jgi:hypothetical protein
MDLGFTNTMLWARGCMSRLLRRMGKLQEAEEQESEIRSDLFRHFEVTCFNFKFQLQELAPLA